MITGILWAVLAAVGSGTFLFLLKLAESLNPFVAGFYVRLAGLLTMLIFVTYYVSQRAISAKDFTLPTIGIVLAAGVCIAMVDIFLLKSFTSGVPAYIAITILSGGSVLLASLLSVLVLGEAVTAAKLIGVGLVVGGVVLLSLQL